METQKTMQRKMNHTDYSGKLALKLVSIIFAVVFVDPTVVWSKTNEWTVYNTANSGLPYNGVTGLVVDTQGTAWIGTGKWNAWAGGGLAKFDGQNWTVYNTSNSGLRHNLVSTSCFDAHGNLWIGSYGGGLAKFDDSNWMVYNTANSGLPHNRAWVTAFDAQGILWIGTLGGGLANFDGSNWTVYNTSNSGLPHNNAPHLVIDAKENLWIGTDNGLAKFDTQNWTVYKTSNSGLPNNTIWALAVDAQDNIWVGTYGSGLARFDGKSWTVYKTSNSGLPDNRIYCITIDAQNNVWIGTESGGLAIYRGGSRLIVDFNGDGIVDSADICFMVDHWGENYPLCDIGPTPLGDGIVDVHDLIVLAEYLFGDVNDPTLIANWALDETEGDIAKDSTNNNDGSVHGDPDWQFDGGIVDGALQLDGIDDYVSTPRVLNPAYGRLSVFSWIKGGAPGQVVIAQKDGVNWLCTDSLEGNLMTELKGYGRGAAILMSQAAITDDNWHRIGLVWDGSHRTLYVDDVAVAEDAQTNLLGSDSGLYIGCGKAMEAGTYWSGLIDDVRIYNRAVTP